MNLDDEENLVFINQVIAIHLFTRAEFTIFTKNGDFVPNT